MYSTVLDWLDIIKKSHSNKMMFQDKTNELSFKEFDDITLRIGTFITKILEPNSAVVVMTGRNVYTPAYYLGIARSSCFYAPIDPTMPIFRLNQMLKVVNASVMLVDKEHKYIADSLEFSGKIYLVEDLLAEEYDILLLQSRRNSLTSHSPLYLIFTSGSSGTPKGVITSHEALMNYISAVGTVMKIDENDVLGNQSPLDYIAAVRDIYLPILKGCSTFIIPKNEFSMPIELFKTLNSYKITTLFWSVSGLVLVEKLNGFDSGKLYSIKKVCFSGSVMPCKSLKVWQENLPNVMFVNQYGPTEATASCTYYIVSELVDESTVLPIGIPYKNYKVFLLDENNESVKIGDIGEICIAGPSLALGYYGDQMRTQEVFVQNPLNSLFREIIYKTGDIGRINEDGILEYCGRKDRQIKHMGHRIELDEIEYFARMIEGIVECCALYNKEKEILSLFYVGTITTKEVALHFRKDMPAFMVPRRIKCLEELPKLPNGKIDIQMLKQNI